MIRSKNRRPSFYIKLVILISYTIAARSLSDVSDGVWARSNTKSIAETALQDTLDGINGKIVDSITQAPIPFATITFYKDDAGSMTIVSNDYGEFSIGVKHVTSKVQISAIGYKELTCYLAADHSNVLRLTPATNLLPNVIVSSKAQKKPNANGIIKKVNKHIEQNYGDLFFDQRFKIFLTTRNYDTTKCERTDLINLHFDKDLKKLQIKKWRPDTVNYDTVFFNFIGASRLTSGDIGPSGDVLRTGLVTSEKQRKNFDFRLLAHYQDKNMELYTLSASGPTPLIMVFFCGDIHLQICHQVILREKC